jgi:putative two-component system response regulator
MTTSGLQKPSREVQELIERGDSSLAVYAGHLKQLLETERQRRRQLAVANQKLEAETESLRSIAAELSRQRQEVEDAHYDTIVRLTRASEYKDPESSAHIVRMSHYSEIMVLHLELGTGFAQLIHGAAPMHDVGKIGVPDTVLLKEGPLTDREWETMKLHPTIGAQLLEGSRSPLLDMARQIALSHHEHWDGSGYPDGIRGDTIPMSGRIVLLADRYDALRCERPYKTGFSHEKAVDIIVNGDERSRPEHFDPKLLHAFQEINSQFDDVFRLFRE